MRHVSSPPGERPLAADVYPAHYAVSLWVDPADAHFRGALDLTADLGAATRTIRLHGKGLHLTRAEALVEGRRIVLTVEVEPPDAIALVAQDDLPAGQVRLHLEWTGTVSTHPEGLYRVVAEGRSYLFTQFQPLAARQVIPCFDEPGHKATWAMRIHAPTGCTVAANGRCLERRAGNTEICWQFATTPPMPTYLVAFAVGPFDVIEGDPDGPVPLRVLTVQSRAELARFALACTPRMLGALAKWCGRPFPYEKIDLVAVPDFAAGAMENVGLITFRERLLLVDPDATSAEAMRWAVLVLAHELAHMWFGNLVTMGWWDDLWLNEAFATLLEAEVAEAVAPEYGIRLDAVRDVARVMDHDALAQARAVRQPIEDPGDIRNAFDGITYTKGAAVLRMLRAWMGKPAFLRAVRRWLGRNAHGTGDTEGLLADFLEVEPEAALLTGFLDQPGVPQVEVRRTADARTVELHQRRYAPAGVTLTEAKWTIPVQLRYGDGMVEHHVRCLLDGPVTTVHLEVAPRWLHPNDDEAGYYRWQLPDIVLAGLIGPFRDRLTERERVALPGHLWALLEAGQVEVDLLLRATLDLLIDPTRSVVEAAITVLSRMHRRLVPDSHQNLFARRCRKALAPAAERIGLFPRVGEVVSDALLRPTLLEAQVRLGDDQTTRKALGVEADETLAQRTPDPARSACAWPIAAIDADRERFTLMVDALGRAATPTHRAILVRALGSIEDPLLIPEVLGLYLTSTFRAQDLHGLLRPLGRHRRGRDAVLRWLDERYAAIVSKAGEGLAAHLPQVAAEARTASERDAWERLFRQGARRPAGTDRILRQVLEGIDRNIRLVAHTGAPLRAALSEG